MNRLRIAVVTFVLGLSMLTLPQPAQADTPGCVTHREFRKVDSSSPDAWTRRHVTRVFDTRGTVTASPGHRLFVIYKTCSPLLGPAEIIFFHHRAWFKFWPKLP